MAQLQGRKNPIPIKSLGTSHDSLPVANKRKRKDSDAGYGNDRLHTKKKSRRRDEELGLQARGTAEASTGTINDVAIAQQDNSGIHNEVKKKYKRHRKESGHGDDFLGMTLDSVSEAAVADTDHTKQKSREQKRKKETTVNNELPDPNAIERSPRNPDSTHSVRMAQLVNGGSIQPVTTTQASTTQLKEKKKKRKERAESLQDPSASQTPIINRSSKHEAMQFTPINGEADSATIEPSRKPRSVERAPAGDIIPPRILSNGPKGGMWTEEEKALVDEVFHEVCAVENIDEAQLAENVAAGEKTTAFLNCLREALPMRTRDSIRKFCQRQYRRGTRGPWSAEEDAILQEQLAQRGKKWAEIARIVDRTPDDCRDRYKNILQYGSDREQGTWSRQDAVCLYRAVEECIAEITDYTEGDVYDFVNWEVVANKMGHRRSAKRCREKWQKLRERGFSDQMSLEEWTVDRSRIYWQRGPVEKQFAYFKDGDKYDALMEVCSAFKDPTEIFPSEQSFWTRVSAHVGESRFDKRLRRYTFYHLLEQCESTSITQEPSKAMQAKMLAEKIVQEAQRTSEDLERGYDEDCFCHPVAKARRVKAEAIRKANAAQKRAQKPHRSEEFVYESDDSDHSPVQPDLSLLSASANQVSDESTRNVRPSHPAANGINDSHSTSPMLQHGKSGAGLKMETAAEHQDSTVAVEPSSQANATRTPRKKGRKQKTGLAPADHDLPKFLTPSQPSASHSQGNEVNDVVDQHGDDEESRKLKKLEKKKRREERRRRQQQQHSE